jgi:hypothetical protein
MTPDPPDPLRELLDHARTFLGRHDELREAVGLFGRALAALAEWSAPVAPAAPAGGPVQAPVASEPPPAPPTSVAPPAPVPPPEPPVPIASLPPLTFRPLPPPEPHPVVARDTEPLKNTAARCRIKAEAARFAARRAAGDRAADEAADHAELTRRANELGDCFLWMLNPQGLSDRSVAWDHLAAAFDTAAQAVEMLRAWHAAPEPEARRAADGVLHVAAEAQAVLYAAVAAVGRAKPDPDQLDLFVAVREEAERRRVFIARFLKREDHADPGSGPAVARKVADQMTALRRASTATQGRQKLLGNLAYKARRLRDDPAGTADEWPRVVEILEGLVAGGLPPSNVAVRDALLPVFPHLPDNLALPPNAARVFREIDRYLELRAEAEPTAAEAVPEPPSAELAAAAALLRGKEAVLIGGLCRTVARAALIRELGLADLHWKSVVDHESVTVFEPAIARPEVAVVLLAIRWSNHSYGDVQEYCDRYGKLLVRLPGGYHPNQVAHQIMLQAGDRLRAAG